MSVVFPDGFFVPQTHDDGESPPGIVADAIDPRTGEYLSISRGFDPTDGAVLTALSVVRGSGSAVTDTGQRFQDLQLVDSSAQTFIDQEARRALKRLKDSSQIAIEKVEPTTEGDWGEVLVQYQNIAKGRRQQAPVSPGRAIA